jgi:fructose-1,6-bisphosphatase/sedoheptulose 1,7-bisphosphatase-like protein
MIDLSDAIKELRQNGFRVHAIETAASGEKHVLMTIGGTIEMMSAAAVIDKAQQMMQKRLSIHQDSMDF